MHSQLLMSTTLTLALAATLASARAAESQSPASQVIAAGPSVPATERATTAGPRVAAPVLEPRRSNARNGADDDFDMQRCHARVLLGTVQGAAGAWAFGALVALPLGLLMNPRVRKEGGAILAIGGGVLGFAKGAESEECVRASPNNRKGDARAGAPAS